MWSPSCCRFRKFPWNLLAEGGPVRSSTHAPVNGSVGPKMLHAEMSAIATMPRLA
jgi:hypothetical protein